MLQRFLLIFCFSISTTTITKAQDILLFPESTFKPSETMSVQACMSQCDEMMAVLQEEKEGNLLDKVKAKFNKLADLHENPTENMLANINNRARQLVYMGKHEFAATAFKKIVAIQKQKYGVESNEYAAAIVDLARADILLIRYANAIGLLEEALNIYAKNETKESFKYLMILNELALLQFRAYEFNSALKAFNEALGIVRVLGKENTIYHAILINNIAAC